MKLKPSLTHQYGIKMSSAIHNIPKASRTFVNAFPTSIVLQLDIANAFGFVSRHALLNALMAHRDQDITALTNDFNLVYGVSNKI